METSWCEGYSSGVDRHVHTTPQFFRLRLPLLSAVDFSYDLPSTPPVQSMYHIVRRLNRFAYAVRHAKGDIDTGTDIVSSFFVNYFVRIYDTYKKKEVCEPLLLLTRFCF